MTYEEIKKKYPIGKILREENFINKFIRTYYNKNDLIYYKTIYKDVEIQDNNTCICTEDRKNIYAVEGWLFNGKEWMPARDTWDGWIPFTEEELESYK